MRELVRENINGRKVLILFILTNICYVFMLTITIPKVMSFSGGMKLLDMVPTGYGVEYVNSLLNVLGDNGRYAYLFNQLPVDMVYPILFAITYPLVLAFFLNKLKKLDSYLFYFCLLPLFSGFFDYCENIGIISILSTYPYNSDNLTQITNTFSVLKSFSTTIYFITLTGTLVVMGVQRLFNQTNK
jgi:hypothetical protein